MLQVVLTDCRRLFKSKAVWILLLVALATMVLQTVKEALHFGYSAPGLSIDVTGFLSFLSADGSKGLYDCSAVLARDASPLVRFMRSFWYLDYLVLSGAAVFGGFFAHDLTGGYDILRRVRGLSHRKLFTANLLTIIAVSFIFSLLAMAALFLVCLLIGSRPVNAFAFGQMLLMNVFFLPWLAAESPSLYVALFILLTTLCLTFVGLLGRLLAGLFRNVLIATVSPVALISGLSAAMAGKRVPWLFLAFDYDNLAIAPRAIFDWVYVYRFSGVYLVWILLFVLIGLFGPQIGCITRRFVEWNRQSFRHKVSPKPSEVTVSSPE